MSGWWHVDCEGEIGWVPASFIKPVYGGDDDDDDIVTEIFDPGQGKNSLTVFECWGKHRQKNKWKEKVKLLLTCGFLQREDEIPVNFSILEIQ